MNKYKIIMNNENIVTLNSELDFNDFVGSLKGAQWLNVENLEIAIQISNISTVHLVKK